MRALVKISNPQKWALWTVPDKSESLSLSFPLSVSFSPSFPLSRLCTRGYDSESSEGNRTVEIKEKKKTHHGSSSKKSQTPKSELYGLFLMAKVSLSLSLRTVEIKKKKKRRTMRAPVKNLKPPKMSFMDCSYWQKCESLSLSLSLSLSFPLSLSFSLSFPLSRLCTRGYDSESSEGDKTVEIKGEKKKRRSMRAPVKNLKPQKVSFMDCSYWQKWVSLSVSRSLSRWIWHTDRLFII